MIRSTNCFATMKRYIKYIFLSLISNIFLVSCIEELESPQQYTEEDVFTLVPRVRSFTNQYVTKADDKNNETNISSLHIFVFDNNGKNVFYQSLGTATTASLNKSVLNSPSNPDNLKEATIVMIANKSLSEIVSADEDPMSLETTKTTVSYAKLLEYSFQYSDENTAITSIGDDFYGFPMVGIKEQVDLSAASSTGPISVDMKILYAKVNFKISVADTGENTGTGMSFKLENYSIFNISKETKLAEPGENVATVSSEYAYTGTSGAAGNKTNSTTNLDGDAITFTFYVAETRYNPGTFTYPLSGLHESYKQQYKPSVAAANGGLPGKGLATYVQLVGTYVDYRGTEWGVKYKVYLGKDNYQNFHVDRNSEYTNILTIKGIRNNDDYGNGKVWLDHRVEVTGPTNTNSAADHITITRETLIDSHFEVRPLRIKLPSDISRVFLYMPKYPDKQINETEHGVNENWIAVENNNGRIKDFTLYSDNGKRKYFTTNLIKQLYLENNDQTYGIKTNDFDNDPRKGQKYIQLFDGDCAWFYIDENTSEDSRPAIIDLVFYDNDGNVIKDESISLIQKGLVKINDNLYIERYEEYLHSYDSQDLYTDPTKDYTQQGYKWGLEGISLSNSQNVVAVLPTPSDRYFYDYFHAKDKANVQTLLRDEYFVVGAEDLSKHTGLNFTNYTAGPPQNMSIIDMSTRPSSAIQYCLSKNKFRVDESSQEKHTMDIHWYLPDAYEMSDILSGGKDLFSDFNNNLYWTSQPSWTTGIGAYLYEDENNARAVSLAALSGDATYQGTNTGRDELHRIRCAYSHEGILGVDFSGGRAPEGIGAMHFYMKAWKDWDTREPGYFGDSKPQYGQRWLLDNAYTPSTSGGFTMPDNFAFPRVKSDADSYTGAWVDGYGFEENPPKVAETYTERVGNNNSYVAANKWPGLTTKKVVSNGRGNNIYYTLEGKKEESVSIDTTYTTKYNGDITAESALRPLDHLYNGNDLSISFIKGDKSTNSPKYEYSQKDSTKSKQETRVWEIPTYKKNTQNINTSYSLRTPGGQILLTDAEQKTYDDAKDYTILGAGYKKSRESNNDGYIYPTKEAAIAAGNAATQGIDGSGNTITIPTGIARTVTAEETSSDILLFTYYTGFGSRYKKEVKGKRYRYRVKYTIQGQTYDYYEYQNGGKWNKTITYPSSENQQRPTTDQLIMYGGNSFTIKAANNTKISSVKIYFSGSNKVGEITLGNNNYYYLRFTKDGAINPSGMTYSGDGENGVMTWSGDPQVEVTFKLVVYHEEFKMLNFWGEADTKEYLESYIHDGVLIDFSSYNKSITIDQIDVRYK